MRYESIGEVGRGLSDAQLELMLLLANGYELVTNEGSGYRCWLELERLPVDFTIRNQTANVLHSKNLLIAVDEELSGFFRYQLADRGRDVLSYVYLMKQTRLPKAVWSVTNKGVEGIRYPLNK